MLHATTILLFSSTSFFFFFFIFPNNKLYNTFFIQREPINQLQLLSYPTTQFSIKSHFHRSTTLSQKIISSIPVQCIYTGVRYQTKREKNVNIVGETIESRSHNSITKNNLISKQCRCPGTRWRGHRGRHRSLGEQKFDEAFSRVIQLADALECIIHAAVCGPVIFTNYRQALRACTPKRVEATLEKGGGNSENSGRRLREAGVWFSLLLFKRSCKLARQRPLGTCHL